MDTFYPQPWYLREGKPSHGGTRLFSKDNGLCGFSYPQNRASLPSSGESQQVPKISSTLHTLVFFFFVPGYSTKLQPFFSVLPTEASRTCLSFFSFSRVPGKGLLVQYKNSMLARRERFPETLELSLISMGPLIAQALLTQPLVALFLT